MFVGCACVISKTVTQKSRYNTTDKIILRCKTPARYAQRLRFKERNLY